MTDPIKSNETSLKDESKVLISKEAFRNMLTHVLKFGNETLEKNVEVMGVCLGKIAPNRKDVQLVNAIPLIHGSKVSSGFSPTILENFKMIEENYLSQNLRILGLYISNLHWGLFLTDIYKKNLRYIQNEQNPYGFAIVFDYTEMGKDNRLGFEIYRLDNYADKMSEDYHKVDYDIEVPNTLDFFKWVKRFVEDSQRNTPILIKEYHELTEEIPKDLQEIPKPNDQALGTKESQEVLDPNYIVSGFQEGSKKFTYQFINTFIEQLNTWSSDVSQGALNGSKLISESLKELTNKVSQGITKIENWFNKNLNDIVNAFKENLYQFLESKMEDQKEISLIIYNTNNEITKDLNNLSENVVNTKITEIESKIQKFEEQISQVNHSNSAMTELIDKSLNSFTKLLNQTENLSNNISEALSNKFSSLDKSFNNEFNTINKELRSVKDISSKLETNFKKIENLISDLKEL